MASQLHPVTPPSLAEPGRGATRTVERALALLAEVCAGEAGTLTECARRTEPARPSPPPRSTASARRTNESAYLSVRGVNDTAVSIALVEGTHAVRHTSWVGRAVPMEGLAVGRVLTGEATPNGYVAGRDRSEPDVTAIAAPVRYPGGVAGALSVIGPTHRIDEPTMHAYGRIVAHEAALLRRQLGDRPDRQESRP